MTRLTPIRDSIYMLEGSGGNIGVMVGKEGVLLIDTQFRYMYEAIISTIKKISRLEVHYLINTHWHFDHTDGNENFGQTGTTIIAQKNSRKRMRQDQTIQVFNHHQKAHSQLGIPKIAFEREMELHFNNQKINLVAVKNAHTDGDLFVHFTSSNIIHAGDIFVTYGYPFIDTPNGGTIQGVITAIDKMITLSNDQTKIIPGHGKLSSKADLINYRQMLVTIFNRVKKEYVKGLSLQEIIQTHPTRGYSSDKINESIFVEIIIQNLSHQ